MAFLSHNSSDTTGFAPLMNVLFWGRYDFPKSFFGRDMSMNVSKEVLWLVRGSYQTIWGSPLPNVTRHSGGWPIEWHPPLMRHYTNFWPFTDLDLITKFDFLPKYVVSIEALQRLRHANRGCLLLRTPGLVPLWDLHVFLCRDQSLLNLSCFLNFEFRASLCTFVLILREF